MTTISVNLDHRAIHRIQTNGAIQLNYKNHWISVCDDTTNVRVYENERDGTFIFESDRSNEEGWNVIDAMMEAKAFINNMSEV